MLRKASLILLLSIFTLFTVTCRSIYIIEQEELQEVNDNWIIGAVTHDGEYVSFVGMSSSTRENPATGTEVSMITGDGARLIDSNITGIVEYGTQVSIPIEDVQMVYILKTDGSKTLYACGTIALVAGGIAILIAELGHDNKPPPSSSGGSSCPFIYSYDGSRFVFNGEPYGRAICPELQRTDWCQMEDLVPANGTYRLLMTNEMNETQYTDELRLLAIDHPPGVSVIPDAEGNFYSIADIQSLFHVESSCGEDITRWLIDNDPLSWRTSFPPGGFDADEALRDTILISLPRPSGAETGKLLVNATSTMWASLALKEALELQGAQSDFWYDLFAFGVESGLAREIDLQQEVFLLNVAILEDDIWVNRGVITGGGPLASEDRIIPIDLSGVEGDTLMVRLTPPIGFWKMNWVAVDYSAEQNFTLHEINALSMSDDPEMDKLNALGEIDGEYYEMSEFGQWAELEFPVPEEDPNLSRTVYAMVSGYYDIHLDPDAEFRPELIARILTEPEYLYRFAAAECNRWIAEQLYRTGN